MLAHCISHNVMSAVDEENAVKGEASIGGNRADALYQRKTFILNSFYYTLRPHC